MHYNLCLCVDYAFYLLMILDPGFFFYCHFELVEKSLLFPLSSCSTPPPVLVPTPLDALNRPFLRISKCCSISRCAISAYFAHLRVLV